MDTITALAYGIRSPTLDAAGLFLDNALIYAAVVFIFVFSGEDRSGKRIKIILSLTLAVLLSAGIKAFIAHERPCSGEGWCPDGYSLPSMHAAAAFTLMIGFLNKRSYPVYLLFALFVAFTRLNLGVHVFQDVAGALPVAMVSYYLADIGWRRWKDGA
jgi:membrane-associated phospholipid phosphatase